MRPGYNVVAGFAIVLSLPRVLECLVTPQALAATCISLPAPQYVHSSEVRLQKSFGSM